MNARWLHWFKKRRWKPFTFQEETWSAYAAGQSGLVHAPTGLGKTYAVWGGPVQEWLDENPDPKAWPKKAEPLRVLWITPLRALANDSAESLRYPITEMKLPWTVELRTGDTSAAMRRKQKERFPTALITTPESLSLLLTHADSKEKFGSLQAIIVDEWHELIGSKRGVQTELCMARLRYWFPNVRVWGLSATLGNLDEALQTLLGSAFAPEKVKLVSAHVSKKFEMKTLVPSQIERFPWSGHSGLNMLPAVIQQISKKKTTLLFTNTRSQTEIWFQALHLAKPEWRDEIAAHHGSIDRAVREEVETRLREGKIKCVVCTSSLDLGVDFSPVEQVIQIGAPKGIARMLQRAGRSGHQPGALSRIFCVPAHALELVEFAAVRDAIALGDMESRKPAENPLDLLAQHVITIALGGGFTEKEVLEEIRSTYSYRKLTDLDWQWVLEFVTKGGHALRAYPQFQKVQEENGIFFVNQPVIAQFHRMSIGTITSDSALTVKLKTGGYLGTIEEGFIARLRPGDAFSFAGQQLELIRVRDMTAIVRKATKSAKRVPQWLGGNMALSSQLARAVRQKLEEARQHRFEGPEMKAIAPVLNIQAEWSIIPSPDELLIEWTQTREGYYYFIYPFAGRLAHEGLAALTAYRLARNIPRSFTMTMNDYGFALATDTPIELDGDEWKLLLSPESLTEDLLDCLNSGELTKRKFREIARVAGLIFQGYPGSGKTMRQLQISSGLLFEVFSKYDPDNLLLNQARREVMDKQLEMTRLKEAMEQTQTMRVVQIHTSRLTPLSFPLWAMWMQGQHSTEVWGDRVRRMAEQLETAAIATLK